MAKAKRARNTTFIASCSARRIKRLLGKRPAQTDLTRRRATFAGQALQAPVDRVETDERTRLPGGQTPKRAETRIVPSRATDGEHARRLRCKDLNLLRMP